ncbi:MAG: bifunctional aspartate kinase/homoserine dehydrogenase I, partial [Bacteroidaceae bacterium]|nr:bifunctional aspartate kinase/homoserine dehydrogenase I [Bacteroidaceae bacterium]
MKVLKFGGSSVGMPDSILSVKRIVESQPEPVIVVVSALGGITDQLIRTSQMAVEGNADYQTSFAEMCTRHEQMIDAVIPAGDAREVLWTEVKALLEELRSIYQGVYLIRDLTPKTSAAIVSYGERISSLIVATLIGGAKWFDSRRFIKTEEKGGRRRLATELTYELVRQTWQSVPKVSLVPGFISSDAESGEVTNLGRGGSDYTASIIAA